MHLRAIKKKRIEVSLYDSIGVDKEGNEITLVDVLNKISKELLMLPEMIIDSINETALNTIDDIIIEPGAFPPEIDDEYCDNVKKVVNI